MRELLGGEAGDLESSLDEEPATGLRVNTLKLAPADFERNSPWRLEPVPWCPAGYVLSGPGRPGLHPFHAAGLYYLQDPSAMAVAQVLAPRQGELILDLAAAPGGKTTHLAALLGDDGVLVANDVNAGRARELSRNLERWGCRRTLLTSSEPADLARSWGAIFDAVLLDAPCSGEGMFRKTPQAVEQWTPDLVEKCARLQDTLLDEAARLVKPGGRLVYSTCTFEPEENERVVARFLASRSDWQLLPTGLAAVDSGRPQWAGDFARSSELSLTSRFWPHRCAGEGHFVALLQRQRDSVAKATPGPSLRAYRSSKAVAKKLEAELQQVRKSWREFIAANLERDPLPEHDLLLRSDGLYAVPPGGPSLDGLRVLRPGVWLGQVEHGRVKPSHALALALQEGDAGRIVDLGPDDPRLYSYLLGAELEVPGSDGWVLIKVAGHPLGWGRRARDIVKNQYPKGLRRQPGK